MCRLRTEILQEALPPSQLEDAAAVHRVGTKQTDFFTVRRYRTKNSQAATLAGRTFHALRRVRVDEP